VINPYVPPPPPVHRGHWTEDAACADCCVDPEWFHPLPASNAKAEQQTRWAKAVCRDCPVRQACLDWALETNAGGIAGGLTHQERMKLGRPRRATAVREHGTQRGYNQHKRASEIACVDCKAAEAKYVRDRKAERAS